MISTYHPLLESADTENGRSRGRSEQPDHQQTRQMITQHLTEICLTAIDIERTADNCHTSAPVFSPDGRWQADATLDPKTDLQRWQISKNSLGGDGCLPAETVENVYPTGIAWRPDSSGFFYDRYLPYPGSHALYFHQTGTEQSEDRPIFNRPEQPDWHYQPFTSPDGRWLAISILNGSACNQIILIDLTQSEAIKPLPLINRFVGRYDPLHWETDRLILRAVEPEALNGRLIAIDLTDFQPTNRLSTLLSHSELPLLDAVSLDSGWAVSYLNGGCAEIRWLDHQGTQQQIIPLPGLGTVADLVADGHSGQIEFAYSDHVRPWQRFRWRPGDTQLVALPCSTPPLFCAGDPERFVTRRHWVTSPDGVALPIFLTYRRGVDLANRPTLVNAYGGMGVSLTPCFSADSLAWVEMGGVFVTVCARGGGELGAAWHEAAVGAHKQRTFDDVLAAVRWLHRQGITSPPCTGLWGSSNGGLTAGACLTQAPELFGAVVIEAGLLDMLNYHRLGRGADWLAEYGSPDVADQRANLAAYSPLHNICAGMSYPATLITTSDQDSRVGEAHSYHFAQALQAAQAGPAPILLRVDEGGGHESPLFTPQWFESAVDRLTFFAIQLDL